MKDARLERVLEEERRLKREEERRVEREEDVRQQDLAAGAYTRPLFSST